MKDEKPNTMTDMLLLVLHGTMTQMGFGSLSESQALENWRLEHGAGRMYAILYTHRAMANSVCSIRGISLSHDSVLVVASANSPDGGAKSTPIQSTLQVPWIPSRETIQGSLDARDMLTWLGHTHFSS